jgi:hypothetical protein
MLESSQDFLPKAPNPVANLTLPAWLGLPIQKGVYGYVTYDDSGESVLANK